MASAMKKLACLVKSYLKAESGAVAIEYALIAVALSVAIITAFPFVTSAVSAKFQNVADAFTFFS